MITIASFFLSSPTSAKLSSHLGKPQPGDRDGAREQQRPVGAGRRRARPSDRERRRVLQRLDDFARGIDPDNEAVGGRGDVDDLLRDAGPGPAESG